MKFRSAFPILFALLVLSPFAATQEPPGEIGAATVLGARYDLSKRLAPTAHRYYLFESSSEMLYISAGEKEPRKRYRFFLDVRPSTKEEKGLYHCHLKSYSLTIGDGEPQKIDGLSSYDYSFAPGETGYNDKGELFGISHKDFEGARVGGKALGRMESFTLYLGLIDFHTFEAVLGDPNVMKLTGAGQRAMVSTAGRDLPIHLGDVMLKGSIQTMGESPVDTIGLRLHHGQPCMVYRYSLESTVSLLLAPMPGVTIKMTGPSCFQGTITAEIDTGLISAADFTEHVVGTNFLGAQKLHDFVTRRDGRVVRITREQYDREEVP